MIELTSAEAVEIPGRGLAFMVEGFDMDEPEDLAGQEVILDGAVVRVRAVETFMVARPYPKGLGFGLLLEDDAAP